MAYRLAGPGAHPPGRLWVVRHAEVLVKGYCYGRTDVQVAVSHAEAATRVIDALGAAAHSIRVVWASPSERTRELARAIARILRRPLAIDHRLQELDFGAWEGKTYDAIFANDGDRFTRFASAPLQTAAPFGESGNQLIRRVCRFYAGLDDRVTLAITHAGPIRALRSLALDPPGRSPCLDFTRPVSHLAPELLPLARGTSR